MKPKFYRKVLDNGITILFEKRNVPVVSVAFAVRCGGVNESVSEKGISHFIEHMLYKGTSTRNAKQIAEEIEKKGGDLNGFTSEEITAYWCKMPGKHLNVALEVLSDMVKNPLFDEKEIEKERKVIFEEIKMYHDNPMLHVFDEIQKSLYTGTMKMNLAGTIKTMSSIDKNKILKKFGETYTPNNMIFCVVGGAEFGDLVNFVQKNFGKKKRKIQLQNFSLRNESKIEERKGIDQANLVLAYHTPAAKDKKCYAAKVLSVLMAGGMSSRLWQEIREKKNLAYAVKGDASINKTFSYNFIYVGTIKENVEKVKKIILNEFEKVSKELTEKELRQVKEQIVGNYQISTEDSRSQMANLLLYEINTNAKELYEFEKKIRAVKLNDVKNLAKIKKYSFFALVPK